MKKFNYQPKKNTGAFKRKEKDSSPSLKSRSIHQFPEIIAAEEKVQAIKLKVNTDRIIDEGYKDAADNIPSADITDLSYREKEYRAILLGLLSGITSTIKQVMSRLRTEIQVTEKRLNSMDPEKDTNYYFTEHFAEERNTAEDHIAAKYDGGFLSTKERMEKYDKEARQCESKRNAEIEKTGDRPIKRWLDTSVGYGAMLSLLALFELPLNYSGAQGIGEFPNAMALLIGLGLSVYLILAAHLAGEAYSKKIWWQLCLSVLMAGLLFAVISVFRSGDVILASINMVVFLLGTCFSYHRTQNRRFFLMENRITTLTQQKGLAQKEIKEIEKMAIEEKEAIYAEFWEKAEELANRERIVMQNAVDTRTVHLRELDNYLMEKTSEINSLYYETICLYRNSNEKERQRQGYDFVNYWRENDPPSSLQTERVEHFSNNHKKNGAFNGLSSVMTTLLLLVFSIFFGATGCTDAPPRHTDAVVIVDITSSSDQNTVQDDSLIAQYIVEQIYKMDGSATRDYGTVTISSVGETSFQQTSSIILKPGKSYLLETEKVRENEIADFKKNIQTAIGQRQDKIGDQHNSQVYRNLCQHLPRLAKSNAERKALLIFSDLIEHTSSKVSFYQYKNNPEKIIEDYEKISGVFSTDCELGDLSGIEITVVHLPHPNHDEIFVNAKKFWQKYLLAHGASTVTFVSNI